MEYAINNSREDNKFILKNERLTVEVARPGTVYNGPRFDWTGFITQVTLDDKHTFCPGRPVFPEKDLGIAGLCNEFGIFTPIGYEEVKPGGKFTKLGVGLLTRYDNRSYSFSNNYIIEPYPIDIAAEGAELCYTMGPVDCGGYSARLEKKLSIRENRLKIYYTLLNCGNKPIQTEEYAHNFIMIDFKSIGPDYKIIFSEKIVPDRIPEVLEVCGKQVRLLKAPESPFYCQIPELYSQNIKMWEIRHAVAGVGIREHIGFNPSMAALWGMNNAISPEIFVKINVMPSETKVWSREYEFFYF